MLKQWSGGENSPYTISHDDISSCLPYGVFIDHIMSLSVVEARIICCLVMILETALQQLRPEARARGSVLAATLGLQIQHDSYCMKVAQLSY
eukprot:5073427-Amphidinium_carterae.1